TLRDETNVKLQSAMEEANALMRGIADLNGSIRSATASGADASQAQTEQAGMLDRLSEIIDIRVQDGALGGVEVRTTNGVLLADTDAATLSFGTSVSPQQYPSLSITQPRSSTAVALEPSLQGGELYGLLKVRDSDLADLALGLGEFAAGVADALNAAHNNTTSVPAPATLVGDNTGLLSTDSLNFTGVSHVAITDADGRVVQNLEIDFDAGQITNAAGATTAFTGTIGALTTALNTALGADGSATFTNGSLTLSAAGAGNGVVVQQDETTPSSRSGRGFAHTFGLNNLVEHPTPLSYATGLTGTDAHGFAPGETLTFAFKDENGYVVRDVVYTVGAGATVADMVADMNTALGVDATASLAADGTLTITPTASSRLTSVDIAQDGTARGGTGVSVSELFGLGELAPAGRA
ncbi:MAG: flagellar hook-associated protein FlgK, partial [Pseudomonadota bacterium]